ncbi:hypothetical protein J3S90_06195 [Flavobacterium sp. P4023]|uniref:DKNYY family protein n=1 Tax=Flavobacterium flabelliforme TaxID=2816119 RepID=A0ABS5CRZ8_9FLAO|nr:DUF6770 family protein [Flavobacterium flabelliforme]MBP4141390.1 hypothetical protein [Flavobacterium flabelliforme]
MKKIIFLFILITQFSFGQSYSVLKQADGDFVSFDPFYENTDLFGYVELREMNTDENLNVTFKYIVLDKNMNKICSGEIKQKKADDAKSTKVILDDINYANGLLRFDFYNVFISGSRNFKAYTTLNITTNTIVNTGIYNPEIKAISKEYKNNSRSLFNTSSLGKNGFLINERRLFASNKDPFYNKIHAVDTKNETIWEFTSSHVFKDKYILYKTLATDDNYILMEGHAYKGNNDNNHKIVHYIVLDSKTGKELLFAEVSEKYTHIFDYHFIQNGLLYMGGKYYEKNKNNNYNSLASIGLNQTVFDIKSNSLSRETYLPYEKFKDVEINKSGKVSKEGYLTFQKTSLNPDGTFFVLAESYWQKSNCRTYTQLYTFMMDKDFNPIKTVEYNVKQTKGYKYDFSQRLPDTTGRAYFFFDKTDDRDLELNILNYYYKSKKQVVQKMNISNDNSTISIFPAKTGYVGIAEYYKDQKKQGNYMEIRLEKLNYERE